MRSIAEITARIMSERDRRIVLEPGAYGERQSAPDGGFNDDLSCPRNPVQRSRIGLIS